MKTLAISLPVVILMVACDKTPDDPGRPGKNVVPRMAATLAPPPAAVVDGAELFGETPASALPARAAPIDVIPRSPR